MHGMLVRTGLTDYVVFDSDTTTMHREHIILTNSATCCAATPPPPSPALPKYCAGRTTWTIKRSRLKLSPPSWGNGSDARCAANRLDLKCQLGTRSRVAETRGPSGDAVMSSVAQMLENMAFKRVAFAAFIWGAVVVVALAISRSPVRPPASKALLMSFLFKGIAVTLSIPEADSPAKPKRSPIRRRKSLKR